MTGSDAHTRRRVVKLAGAAAATALVAGCGGPGEEDDELPAEEETGNGQDVDDEENGELDDEENGELDDEEELSVQRDAVDGETA